MVLTSEVQILGFLGFFVSSVISVWLIVFVAN